MDLDIAAGDVPDDTATTAYFVASEALTNAVKHASATRLSLGVAREGGRLPSTSATTAAAAPRPGRAAVWTGSPTASPRPAGR